MDGIVFFGEVTTVAVVTLAQLLDIVWRSAVAIVVVVVVKYRGVVVVM